MQSKTNFTNFPDLLKQTENGLDTCWLMSLANCGPCHVSTGHKYH